MSAMPAAVEALWEALSTTPYSEEERRCAVVMVLTNTRGTAADWTIAALTGVQIWLVQRIRKRLCRGDEPRDVIIQGGCSLKRKEDRAETVSHDLDPRGAERLQSGSEAVNGVRRPLNKKKANNKMGLTKRKPQPQDDNMLWFLSDDVPAHPAAPAGSPPHTTTPDSSHVNGKRDIDALESESAATQGDPVMYIKEEADQHPVAVAAPPPAVVVPEGDGSVVGGTEPITPMQEEDTVMYVKEEQMYVEDYEYLADPMSEEEGGASSKAKRIRTCGLATCAPCHSDECGSCKNCQNPKRKTKCIQRICPRMNSKCPASLRRDVVAVDPASLGHVACVQCGEYYRSKGSLTRHNKKPCSQRKSNGRRYFKCDTCNGDFETERMLTNHLSLHNHVTGEKHVYCKLCNNVYSSLSGVKLHYLIKHAPRK